MKPVNELSFLAGGGETGAIIRACDWESSSLGPAADWPQPLKTSIRILLSTGHPMLIWWGPDLIQFYNDAYRRSIGPERHPSAIGQKGRECWEEIWDVIGPQIDDVMAGKGHTWHVNQLVPITRHGRKEDVYWTYSYGPIDEPDSPNGVGGILVVCTETTEQVLAEQRMKAAEARWRELLHQAPGFICILSGPEHRFEFANPRYMELVDHREIVGKTVSECLPEVADQGFVTLLDNVYRTGQTHHGVASPLVLTSTAGEKDKKVYIDFVYQPVRDENGQVTGVFAEGYDVTERILTTQRLHDEDRRKDEFLAILSHELRNPLAAIRNASELLKITDTDNSRIRNIGEILSRQVSQLTDLVDDLLDVSRITQGRIELKKAPLEVAEAVDSALESLHNMIAKKQHKVAYTKPVEPFFVLGDSTRVVQCITNVIGNAIKYSPAGSEVKLSLNRVEDDVEFSVTDQGAGIKEDMLAKIFDMFVQANRQLDRSLGGLGIGLSLTRRLVEMHGGSVSAESDGLNKGSTFRIRLPLCDAPHADNELEHEELGKPVRVLVVDDNEDAAETLALLLRLKGHTTATANGSEEALTQVAAFDPAVVLLDIGLPEMDGYQVAQMLRERGYRNKLIALTGYGQAEDKARAMEAGFDLHFTKPVSPSSLDQIVR